VVILIVCQHFGEARRVMSLIFQKGFNSYYIVEMQTNLHIVITVDVNY
jgi:hypothetical protein